jgi:uncharacterized membrane protein YgaE (UPF0421/DUF939 family)
LLQATAAGTLAWLAATHVARHHQPFFAPIAAIVALNTTTGERGSNVFRLLLGVFIGIFVGELTTAVLGAGYGRLALAMFVAMIVARVFGGARIVIAQAAAGAILTVAVSGGSAGTERLGDAVIGAAVALLFTQVLFTPEPVRLIRRAAVAALREMSHLLSLTAHSVRESPHGDISEEMLGSVRDLRDRLDELQQMMHAGGRIVRHSLYWRSRAEAVERSVAAARNLELLGGSLLMLSRSALATEPSERDALLPVIHELGRAIQSIAEAPEDRAGGRRAASDALAIARAIAPRGDHQPTPLAAAMSTARLVAEDLIAYVGRSESGSITPHR